MPQPASAAVALLDKAITQLDALIPEVGKPASSAPAKVPQTPAAASVAPQKASSEAHTLFSKALLKVARVLDVEELENSDKLYKLAVDIGGEQRQVCAGLRQFVTKTELQGRLVVAVCNLKPAKLAGVASEAMLLAADRVDDSGRIVRMLEPPHGSKPGDQVFLEGGSPSTDTPKQVKGDVWKAIAGALTVAQGHTATVAAVPLITHAGPIKVSVEIPDGSSIQ